MRLAFVRLRSDVASRAEYDRRHGFKSPVPPSAANGYRTLASAYLHLDRGAEALAAAMERKPSIRPTAASIRRSRRRSWPGGAVKEAAIAPGRRSLAYRRSEPARGVGQAVSERARYARLRCHGGSARTGSQSCVCDGAQRSVRGDGSRAPSGAGAATRVRINLGL